MKKISKASIITLMLAAFIIPPQLVFSSDSRKTFDRLVSELRDNPSDKVLRKKIIEMALDMESRPAKPEEVKILKGKAAYQIKIASNEREVLAAVETYRSALALAPWDSSGYYNLAVAEQRAGLPTEAIEDFRWYIMASPGADDHGKVLAKIGALEVEQEAKKKEYEAAVEQQKRDAAMQQQAAVNAEVVVKQEKRRAPAAIIAGLGFGIATVGLIGCVANMSPEHSSDSYYFSYPAWYQGTYYGTKYKGNYYSSEYVTTEKEIEAADKAREPFLGMFLVGSLVGLVGMGVYMAMGKTPKQSALLDYKEGELAMSVPLIELNRRMDGFNATLFQAQF